MTNADKIRAKSDEQLATDYAALTFWADETDMPYYSGPEEEDSHLNFDEAYNKWLRWLKQEASNHDVVTEENEKA